MSQQYLCGKCIKQDNVIAFYHFVQFFSFFFYRELKKSQIIIGIIVGKQKIRFTLYIRINSYISSLLIRTSKRKVVSILLKNYSKLSRERRRIALATKEECRAIEGEKIQLVTLLCGKADERLTLSTGARLIRELFY